MRRGLRKGVAGLDAYDERGTNYTRYSYDPDYGLNDYTIIPYGTSGQTIYYTYDKDSDKLGRLTRVSSTVGSTVYANSYGYEEDKLRTITHNGFDYAIDYNAFGQTTNISVGNTSDGYQTLVSNTYITNPMKLLLDQLTYGNEGIVKYFYDERDRVSAVRYDGETSDRFTYTYAANGQIGAIRDNQNNLTTRFFYDLAERPMKTVEYYDTGLSRTFQYKYDMDNCLTEFIESFSSLASPYKTTLTYDKDNRIKTINYNMTSGNENVRYSYDAMGRVSSRILETGTSDYSYSYSYLPSNYQSPAGATTNMINTITYKFGSTVLSALTYSYDVCGRIKSVSKGLNSTDYYYDGLGQLIRVNDIDDKRAGVFGSIWTFEYDAGGNIVSKTLYAPNLVDGFPNLSDTDLSDNTVVDSITYSYNSIWKDKLVSYDGNEIEYDEIGNPLVYGDWTFTWEAGRQLKQMQNSDIGTTLQFKYNDAGLRTQKINGSTVTKYYWAGRKLSHFNNGTAAIHIYYDAAGMPTMFYYSPTAENYYYKHNQQGDIIGIVNSSGTEVVSYTYDSWGNQLLCKGSLASTVGAANPLRYRGYIYDSETGLYYLQSRYYNPEWGRFINADIRLGSSGTLLGYNLFLYCRNNAINLADPKGEDPCPRCSFPYYYGECPVCRYKNSFTVTSTYGDITRSSDVKDFSSRVQGYGVISSSEDISTEILDTPIVVDLYAGGVKVGEQEVTKIVFRKTTYDVGSNRYGNSDQYMNQITAEYYGEFSITSKEANTIITIGTPIAEMYFRVDPIVVALSTAFSIANINGDMHYSIVLATQTFN